LRNVEQALIDFLTAAAPPGPGVALSIGDDAAVLDLAGTGNLVVAVDTISDGVDFHLGKVDPQRIGRKALAVNLSDLAAMAATPRAAVVALAMPRDGTLDLATRLWAGMRTLSDEFGCPIVGGDTGAFDGPLTLSVTVLGSLEGRAPLLRSAARPGDAVVVTGRLGGSILGHHLDFTPRVREALALKKNYELHAGIDISDGLALDLTRLCRASGVGATLWADKIPVAPAAFEMARRAGGRATALDHALSDGEDFELLFTAPWPVAEQLVRDRPVHPTWVTIIGRIKTGGELTLVVEGRPRELQPAGWTHQFGRQEHECG